MPNSSPYEDASALDNSTIIERSLATPSKDVTPPKGSEPHTNDFPGEKLTAGIAAGRLPEYVYTNTLPWWRAALRRKCVTVVEWESEIIGKWQVRLFLPSLREAQTTGRSKRLILSFSCFCRRVFGRPG
jgi:hypothetical protein